MKKLLRRIAVLTISLSIFLSCGMNSYAGNSSMTDAKLSEKIIRVGFPNCPGYHEIDENGFKSGYGYELIEKLRIYTGWKVEYVGFDLGIPQAVEMVKNGEIDILTNVPYTEELDVDLLYSDYDIGSAKTNLTTGINNDKYSADNLFSLNGAFIGFFDGDTISYEKVLEFSLSNGFNFTPVYFEDEIAIENALSNGDIGLICSTGSRVCPSEKNVISFSDEYNYIVTYDSNLHLMEEINDGIEKLLAVEPNVFANLKEKYYSLPVSAGMLFTREEREYIESRKEDPIRALVFAGMEPVSYVGNDDIKGIIPDYLRLISTITGLSFEVYGVSNDYDVFNAERDFKAEVRLDALYNYNLAEYYDYRITVPYLSISIATVKLSDYEGNTGRYGFIKSMDPDEYFERKNAEDGVAFNSVKDAVFGLINHSVDYITIPYYTAQTICAQYDEYPLECELQNEAFDNLCFAVFNNDDELLGNILSKAINYVDGSDLQEVIAKNTVVSDKRVLRIDDLFSLYPWLPWAGLIFVLFIISVITILTYKAHASKREHHLALENISYFKSILLANICAVKIEFRDNITFKMYYSNASDPSGTGITESILTSRDIENYRSQIHPEDVELFDMFITKENLLRFIANDTTDYREVRVLNSLGEYAYISVSSHSMPVNGKNANILVVLKDINDTKKEEEEKRKTIMLALESAKRYNESKTRFMSQMSHDIRTPLNAIVGMSTIAKINLGKREKVEECLNIIDDSSEHLLALVNDILDMTKIESGKLSFTNAKVSLSDVLKRSANMFRSKVASSNINFEVSSDDIVHTNVIADATRLEQIFTNIISNAVKYTPQGGSIYVELLEEEPEAEEKRLYEFSVTDTGIGMDEKTISILFNPFERAESVGYMEGAGLGMAITKSIVDAMGGAIHVESELGKGTKVIVSLAFDAMPSDEEDEMAKELRHKKPVIKATAKGKHALIVEDVDINAMFAQAITEMKGFASDIACNGEEAVRMLEQSADGYYSIVLMDIQMPVMNGYEATKAIRSSDREYLRNVPIIAMSANTFEEDVERCKQCGMNEHIAKPVNVNRFSELVDMFVKD